MKTPEQIRNMEFQKSPMGGYKQSDVELFLEEVASEIEILVRQKAEADRRLQEYTQKAPEGGISAAGIQNILINAQRTADAMIEEAKEEASRITSDAQLEIKQSEIKAKEIITEAEKNAILLGETAEKEAAKIIAEAVAKAEEVVATAKESVELEQKLYDRLMIEVSDFQKKSAAQCAAVLELINQLPSEVPFNMERAKTVLALDFNNPEELLENAVKARLEKEENERNAENEAKLAAEEAARQAEEEAKAKAAEEAAKKAEEEAKAKEEAARKAEEEAKAREEAARKAEEEAKAAEEAARKAEEKAKAFEEAAKKAEEEHEMEDISSVSEIEDISSVSEEAKKEAEKTKEAYDDNVIPVIATVAPSVNDNAVANMQLSFDDEEEEEKPAKPVAKPENKPQKGRISFGIDDDDDEDDEPRLFFKKKKK